VSDGIDVDSTNFTRGKPFVVTADDCAKRWSGGKNGIYFRCYLCGHKFQPGDVARWQYTNDIPGAGGNPMVCADCDGTKEEIVAKFRAMHEESKGRMWWFCQGVE
jgi:hypothetical protein